ncbi:hypothetical protein [Achromobacter animicus]|uniref:hypothetical protein n=1 Tax=Achromobacter animicus TaxID=1389935 RepID=UPI0028B00CAE|nr:hypothetical protein [Achromobacter animicus]
MTRNIQIDLGHPLLVNGKPARYQSVWLLLRVWYAQKTGEVAVPGSSLQARYPGNSNLRMIVSRAFRDFAAWGVEVGWGNSIDLPPALLNASRRSQGPFWMTPAQADRVLCCRGTEPASLELVESFLGPRGHAPARAGLLQYVTQDGDYWNHLTQAMRLARDGMTTTGMSWAASYRAADRTALDDFQRALAILKESLAWRRHGNVRRSEAALNRLGRILQSEAVGPSMPTLSAMASVASAWNSYARGDIRQSHAGLDRLVSDPSLSPVIRYNPRVRFEYLNLRALLHKGSALEDKSADLVLRMNEAEKAICALSEALQAAYEADSVEAAQDVAANIGWTLWLFWQQRLLAVLNDQDVHVVQGLSLRWLGLSEWICDRFGVGGSSAWNTVFVLRIARGGCDDRSGDLKRFQAQAPLPVDRMLEAVKPFEAAFSRAKGYEDWSNVAAFTLEENDAGRVFYGAHQVANLLLEFVWYRSHGKGLNHHVFAAVERLAHIVQGLAPGQRRFFRESLKALPMPLQIAAKDATASRAAKKPA